MNLVDPAEKLRSNLFEVLDLEIFQLDEGNGESRSEQELLNILETFRLGFTVNYLIPNYKSCLKTCIDEGSPRRSFCIGTYQLIYIHNLLLFKQMNNVICTVTFAQGDYVVMFYRYGDVVY